MRFRRRHDQACGSVPRPHHQRTTVTVHGDLERHITQHRLQIRGRVASTPHQRTQHRVHRIRGRFISAGNVVGVDAQPTHTAGAVGRPHPQHRLRWRDRIRRLRRPPRIQPQKPPALVGIAPHQTPMSSSSRSHTPYKSVPVPAAAKREKWARLPFQPGDRRERAPGLSTARRRTGTGNPPYHGNRSDRAKPVAGITPDRLGQHAKQKPAIHSRVESHTTRCLLPRCARPTTSAETNSGAHQKGQ